MASAPARDTSAASSDADEALTPYTANSPPAVSSPSGEGLPDDEPPEGRMTFLEHLDELRKRITHAVVALLGGFLVAFAFIQPIWNFVFARLTADIPEGKLIFTEPGEAFFLYLKMAAIAGLLIASPYVMWQVWLFIAPGLYANEKKLAVPFVLAATTLFVGGAAFSHYILFPFAWRFFASFSNEFLAFTPRVEPVWSLYVKLLLAMGLVFQLPMLMFVLARFGIVTARFLARQFKYAVLIFFIISAVITPDGSMVPQLIMSGAMVGLYVVSIAVVWVFGKRRKTDDDTDR
jgi:sec-independent protein translocase protein TatC